MGPTCGEQRGSEVLLTELRRAIAAAGLSEQTRLERELCLGHCQAGPVVLIWPEDEALAAARRVPLEQPGAILYRQVWPADVEALVELHLKQGRPVAALLTRSPVAASSALP